MELYQIFIDKNGIPVKRFAPVAKPQNIASLYSQIVSINYGSMNFRQLELDNQLCFPFYSISRLIIKQYQPYLDKLGITYPQYLVLLVLWEQDLLPVNKIAQKLYLQTNTVTPLLKRMEHNGIVVRQKDKDDERKVLVGLTKKGIDMREQAADIPAALTNSEKLNNIDLGNLKQSLNQLLAVLNA